MQGHGGRRQHRKRWCPCCGRIPLSRRGPRTVGRERLVLSLASPPQPRPSARPSEFMSALCVRGWPSWRLAQLRGYTLLGGWTNHAFAGGLLGDWRSLSFAGGLPGGWQNSAFAGGLLAASKAVRYRSAFLEAGVALCRRTPSRFVPPYARPVGKLWATSPWQSLGQGPSGSNMTVPGLGSASNNDSTMSCAPLHISGSALPC